MTFEDLPKGTLRELSLADPTAAGDVIDLITLEEDRAAGCFTMMLCDGQHRGLQPFVLKEVPADADVTTMADLLGLALPVLAQGGGSILMARGRARGVRPTDADRAWHQAAIEACAAHGVRLLGFHVATADGVFRLPDPLVAAS